MRRKRIYRFALGFGLGSVAQVNLRVIFMAHGIEASNTSLAFIFTHAIPHHSWTCILTSCIFFTACGTKSANFCYKIKNETTDDDAPIHLVSVPRKRVYSGEQKKLSAQSIWIQRIQIMRIRFIKVKMMEVLKKHYPGTDSVYIRLVPLLDCCLQTNLFECIPSGNVWFYRGTTEEAHHSWCTFIFNCNKIYSDWHGKSVFGNC